MLRVKALGELEAEVMDRMWAAGRPMTVREVLSEVNTAKDLAYTTVMTVMNNLHKKEWLRREMIARAWVYSPVATREQYSARVMESALSASNDSGATLVHFVEAMDHEEIQALQAALRQAQARQSRSVGAPVAAADTPRPSRARSREHRP